MSAPVIRGKRWSQPVPSYDESRRRRRAMQAAQTSLGDDADAFLNRHHSGLAGRPMDFAMASNGGLAAVETAICVEARRGVESG